MVAVALEVVELESLIERPEHHVGERAILLNLDGEDACEVVDRAGELLVFDGALRHAGELVAELGERALRDGAPHIGEGGEPGAAVDLRQAAVGAVGVALGLAQVHEEPRARVAAEHLVGEQRVEVVGVGLADARPHPVDVGLHAVGAEHHKGLVADLDARRFWRLPGRRAAAPGGERRPKLHLESLRDLPHHNQPRPLGAVVLLVEPLDGLAVHLRDVGRRRQHGRVGVAAEEHLVGEPLQVEVGLRGLKLQLSLKLLLARLDPILREGRLLRHHPEHREHGLGILGQTVGAEQHPVRLGARVHGEPIAIGKLGKLGRILRLGSVAQQPGRELGERHIVGAGVAACADGEPHRQAGDAGAGDQHNLEAVGQPKALLRGEREGTCRAGCRRLGPIRFGRGRRRSRSRHGRFSNLGRRRTERTATGGEAEGCEPEYPRALHGSPPCFASALTLMCTTVARAGRMRLFATSCTCASVTASRRASASFARAGCP